MKKILNKKSMWERKFQRWTDTQWGDESTSLGKCGYGTMCDYCTDSGFGRACVRALNAKLRTERLTVDYSKADFADVWNGTYFQNKIKAYWEVSRVMGENWYRCSNCDYVCPRPHNPCAFCGAEMNLDL